MDKILLWNSFNQKHVGIWDFKEMAYIQISIALLKKHSSSNDKADIITCKISH